LGIFWKALEWKMSVYFTAVWYHFWPFGIMHGRLVQFVSSWYTFPVLVCLDQEKTGNPDPNHLFLSFTFKPTWHDMTFVSTPNAPLNHGHQVVLKVT
jgi:hypothetical protein